MTSLQIHTPSETLKFLVGLTNAGTKAGTPVRILSISYAVPEVQKLLIACSEQGAYVTQTEGANTKLLTVTENENLNKAGVQLLTYAIAPMAIFAGLKPNQMGHLNKYISNTADHKFLIKAALKVIAALKAIKHVSPDTSWYVTTMILQIEYVLKHIENDFDAPLSRENLIEPVSLDPTVIRPFIEQLFPDTPEFADYLVEQMTRPITGDNSFLDVSGYWTLFIEAKFNTVKKFKDPLMDPFESQIKAVGGLKPQTKDSGLHQDFRADPMQRVLNLNSVNDGGVFNTKKCIFIFRKYTDVIRGILNAHPSANIQQLAQALGRLEELICKALANGYMAFKGMTPADPAALQTYVARVYDGETQTDCTPDDCVAGMKRFDQLCGGGEDEEKVEQLNEILVILSDAERDDRVAIHDALKVGPRVFKKVYVVLVLPEKDDVHKRVAANLADLPNTTVMGVPTMPNQHNIEDAIGMKV